MEIFTSFSEFLEALTEALGPSYEVIFGNAYGAVENNICSIVMTSAKMAWADDQRELLACRYDLVFVQKSAVFSNKQVLLMTDEGVEYQGQTDDNSLYVYSATVTIMGPESIPPEDGNG